MLTTFKLLKDSVSFEPNQLEAYQDSLLNYGHIPRGSTIQYVLRRQALFAQADNVFWWIVLVSMPIITATNALILCDWLKMVDIRQFLIIMCGIWFAVALMWLITRRFYHAKYTTMVQHMEDVLRQPHPEGKLLGVFCEKAIQECLERLADCFIRDESYFDSARQDSGRPVEAIKKTLEDYEQAGAKLEKAICGFNDIFGIGFSRKVLLVDAQKRAAAPRQVRTVKRVVPPVS